LTHRLNTDHQTTREFKYASHVAFDELDMLGILHHSRHLLHLERACHAFFEEVMDAPGFRPDIFPDLHAVVRKIEIEYLRPVQGVGPILVTLRVTRLRSCTMTTAFELRSADGETIFSQGTRETCRIKVGALRPEMWTDRYLERFGAWVEKETTSSDQVSFPVA
jgi:acyl-CoA thioester hydrolase